MLNRLQKLIAAALVCAVFVLPSSAQVPGTFSPMVTGGVAAATITPTDNATQSTVSTTHTYSTRAIGTAFADRIVGVCFNLQPNSTAITAITTVTIGGITATQGTFVRISNRTVSTTYAAAVPTGTTATIVITADQNIFGSAISVYSMANVASVTATHSVTSTGVDPAAGSLNVMAGGVAMGCAADDAGGTVSWSNLTEDTDTAFGSGGAASAAHNAFASAQTGLSIQADFSTPSANFPTMAVSAYR